MPIILPKKNAWTWTNVTYLNDTAAFTRHYEDEGNKLWNTGVNDAELLTSVDLPRMLALPTCVAEFVITQEGGCLPHAIRKFVKEKIDGGETQVAGQKWQLLLDWCVDASQEKGGESLLQLGAPEPALCQDSEFVEWCDQRIQSNLGEEHRDIDAHGASGHRSPRSPEALPQNVLEFPRSQWVVHWPFPQALSLHPPHHGGHRG